MKYIEQLKERNPNFTPKELDYYNVEAKLHLEKHIIETEKELAEATELREKARGQIGYQPCLYVKLESHTARLTKELEDYNRLLKEDF